MDFVLLVRNNFKFVKRAVWAWLSNKSQVGFLRLKISIKSWNHLCIAFHFNLLAPKKSSVIMSPKHALSCLFSDIGNNKTEVSPYEGGLNTIQCKERCSFPRLVLCRTVYENLIQHINNIKHIKINKIHLFKQKQLLQSDMSFILRNYYIY